MSQPPLGSGREVFREFVEGFFSPIASLLDDTSVSEVLINGHNEVHVERCGQLARTGTTFGSENQLRSALRAVAQFLGRSLDDEHPILEGRLPDGSRIQAILPPLTAGGPCVAIRRHRLDSLTVEQLIEGGSLSAEALEEVRMLVIEKKNILVSGGTGSGKTSLLRCVASLIPPAERIVTIEDARELHLVQSHVVSLESRPANASGEGKITIGDLFVATLRMRPDRVVIGELRGGEALDLIQAMTSGHGGCLSTIHASSPADALRRLETLALFRGVDLPLPALRGQITSAVDAIIQVERRSDGRRWVKNISRVGQLCSRGDYTVHPLFDRRSGAGDLFRVSESTPAERP